MYFITSKSLDDAVSVTANEAVSTFPVTKLLDPLGTARWRSIGTTPNIIVEFSSFQLINGWGFWYHNAELGDTVRLRQADTLAGLTAAPTQDITVDLVPTGVSSLSNFGFTHQKSVIPLGGVASLWARLDIDVSGGTAGFFEAGALFLDNRFKVDEGVAFGYQYKTTVRALHSVTLSAGGTGRGGGSIKQDAQLTFKHMLRDEVLGILMPLLRDRRRVKPVAGVVRTVEDVFPMDYMFYGYIDVSAISFNEIKHEVVVPFFEP